ncbi:MAG: hypothetical protein AAF411_11485 [Myxococcota bacterium]
MAESSQSQQAAFDPGGFYEFDLGAGAVRTRDGERVVLVAPEVLRPLVAAAAERGDLTPLRNFGNGLARHAKSSLGGGAGGASPEAVLRHASAVVALFGLGVLDLERWGKALVFRLTESPELDEKHLAVAAFLGGFVSELTGQDIACVPVGDDRFLVTHPSSADRVWALSRGGSSLADIVAVLEGSKR